MPEAYSPWWQCGAGEGAGKAATFFPSSGHCNNNFLVPSFGILFSQALLFVTFFRSVQMPNMCEHMTLSKQYGHLKFYSDD